MAPRLKVCDLNLHERFIRFRKPFRFGAVTVEEASQVFVEAVIEVDGLGRSTGMSAELMVPKWFDKNPALSPAQTVGELRRALEIAAELYRAGRRPDTAFGLHADRIGEQMARGRTEGMPALAAAFGPAEIDKAILDALLRLTRLDVYAGFAQNLMGLDARLTPDLNDATIERFLASRQPLDRLAIRHTIGMADPLRGKGGLAEIHAATGCRFFKIKLSGAVDADLARLGVIAMALAELGVDYRATLDANEQYADPAALAALCNGLENNAALAAFPARLLYIEQPLPREMTHRQSLGVLGTRWAFIIDEADGGYDAFPAARELGYSGVSSKSCKGFYKSLLNGARAAQAGRDVFIAAEDLTCQAGLALQQDSALVAFLGIAHVERNGHHYVDGFAGAPEDESAAFLAAHADLYERRDGQIRLKIRDGAIDIASLKAPGFASAILPKLGSAAQFPQKEYVSS
ncbi:MAG TPA: hypothetical protein VF194_15070 [Ferrovibrio sp.]|uniref:hypothetical protein n=1 Tax=Ferrovibrio sp. TaxID=1917215 RepID=UPI002ED07F26